MALDKLVDSTALDNGLTTIANAIRTKGGTTEQLAFPNGMAQAIEDLPSGGEEIKRWIRPSEFPDYSLVDISNEEVCYFTIDTQCEAYPDGTYFGIICTLTDTSGSYLVEVGSLINGIFTATSANIVKHNNTWYMRVEPSEERRYIVVRVTVYNVGHMDSVKIRQVNVDGVNYTATYMPVVERYARLPYDISNATYQVAWWTIHMVADTILDRGIYAANKLTGIPSISGSFYKYINYSGWDVSNVTTCYNTMSNCYGLLELHLNGWNLANCTSMSGMLRGCYSLQELDFSNVTTSIKLTNLSNIIRDCYSLKRIIFGDSFNVSKVTDISGIFFACTSLTALDLKSLNIESVTNVGGMFQNCYSLRSVDLSGWDVSNVTSATYLLSGVPSLISADFSGWDFRALTNNGGGNFLPSAQLLTDIIFPKCYTSVIIKNLDKLSRESLLGILNGLPSVSTTQTLTMSNAQKSKLTTAELAIATGKGWTIA